MAAALLKSMTAPTATTPNVLTAKGPKTKKVPQLIASAKAADRFKRAPRNTRTPIVRNPARPQPRHNISAVGTASANLRPNRSGSPAGAAAITMTVVTVITRVLIRITLAIMVFRRSGEQELTAGKAKVYTLITTMEQDADATVKAIAYCPTA
jgi:hypothetical protein